jgi:hypothetical protein
MVYAAGVYANAILYVTLITVQIMMSLYYICVQIT